MVKIFMKSFQGLALLHSMLCLLVNVCAVSACHGNALADIPSLVSSLVYTCYRSRYMTWDSSIVAQCVDNSSRGNFGFVAKL